ncbi:MAG TPA: PspC domain-containing protein, partial [Qipengyuania sp.]|nr:PspC domain-containing protein [Qipengyuania sp.]
MSRRYKYSFAREDKKLAGVCSTLGERFGMDPTFLRIGFVAFALLIEWEIALIAYIALGIYFTIQRKKALNADNRLSDFEKMDRAGKVRPSIHALRTELDATDRR